MLPSSSLAVAIDIQSDAVQHAAIDADELRRELQVIIQEAKRKLDTPSALVHETLHEVMYDRHRIRRWRIGLEAELAGFTRDDLWAYYRSRYVPERTIVSIVGDLDEEDALALARKHYEDWAPRPGAVDSSPTEPERREVRSRTLRGDVNQSELALGWRGVPALDSRAVPLDLAAAVLAMGRGSWLYRALRETGLVTGVSAHHYSPTEIGVFSIGADFDAPRMNRVLQQIAGLCRQLAERGPGAEDLERARTLSLARWSRRMESMEGRASALAGAESLGGLEVLDQEFAQLARATGDEVREVAVELLTPDSVSAVIYHPDRAGDDLAPERLAGIFGESRTPALASPALPDLGSANPQPDLGRAFAASESEIEVTELPAFDLLVRRKAGVPLITLGVYFPRREFDPPDQAGLGALAMRSAIRGAGGLDAAGLAFAIERLGGTLSSSAGLDWLGFGTGVLAEHLSSAAGLLDLALSEPSYIEAQVLAERALLVEEALQAADDMFRFPFQLAFRAAFGPAGYGLPPAGLPETLAGLEASTVRRWHAECLSQTRGVIVAVGDCDPAQMRDELAAVFSRHSRRLSLPAAGPVSWALNGRPAVDVVTREKAQSAFAMVFPGPSRRAPARFAADVWAAVASGLGGRLFEALRDRRSLAYSVMASSWQKARGGAFVTYIATSPTREEEARAAMLGELELFAREPLSAEELGRATNYLAGQTEVNRQSAVAIAGEIVEAWLAGNGLADLRDPAAQYRAVTAEQVRAVAEVAISGTRAEGVVRGTGGGR